MHERTRRMISPQHHTILRANQATSQRFDPLSPEIICGTRGWYSLTANQKEKNVSRQSSGSRLSLTPSYQLKQIPKPVHLPGALVDWCFKSGNRYSEISFAEGSRSLLIHRTAATEQERRFNPPKDQKREVTPEPATSPPQAREDDCIPATHLAPSPHQNRAEQVDKARRYRYRYTATATGETFHRRRDCSSPHHSIK